ncbi:MAG: phosphate ABC transporter permease PstA [Peptococcaceae bacterium]|nr:phosphate ABC transporter permease PstA [Peptococcaceae bacterium]
MKKLRTKDAAITVVIWLCALLTVSGLLWLVIYIVANGLSHINLEFLLSEYKGDKHGILPMILSTCYIVLLSLAISAPIGIGAAIYLVEFTKPGRLLQIIRFATETLAGIPSIIYGLFGFIFFVNVLKFNFSLLSGALTLSIMVLPVIIRTTEETLKAVPLSYREGSLALGATKIQTIWKIILPSAIPGILTAVILSVGRIVGETAAVYLTAGMVTRFATSVMDSGRTLAVHLYMLAKEGLSFEQAFATATVLIVTVALINLLMTKTVGKIKKTMNSR